MWLRAELKESCCADSLVLVILLTNLPLMCKTEGIPAHFPVSHHDYLDLLVLTEIETSSLLVSVSTLNISQCD